ncbi:transposase [Kineosporia sp. J2-2]|uniref:Mutator family transposase n=1 Tax=Kineosporia corallincola TaxID=2835133 RepID=A0ABS5TFS2_9ACTN|nr:transposase [Kineosporia corallincola]
MTIGEVSAHFAGVYGASVGQDQVSRITDAVIAEMTEWLHRSLDRVYPAVFIDAIVVKIRQPRGERLAADVAGGHLDQVLTREFLCLGHARLDAVGEVERRPGVPALGPVRWVTTTTWSMPLGGVPSRSSVRSNTWRPVTVTPIWSQYGRTWS